jgi:hypothetical protein
MQELFPFTKVACRATYNQIRGVVGASTNNRDNVVNVIFRYSIFTIITFSMLVFILLLDVLQSKRARCALQPRATLTDINSSFLFPLVLMLTNIFLMARIILRPSLSIMLSMRGIIISRVSIRMFFMRYMPATTIGYCLFPMGTAPLIRSLFDTILAGWSYAIYTSSLFMKVFRRCWINLLTLDTFLMSLFRINTRFYIFVLLRCAWFTPAIQAVACRFTRIKVFDCCWFIFSTLRTSLISIWNNVLWRFSMGRIVALFTNVVQTVAVFAVMGEVFKRSGFVLFALGTLLEKRVKGYTVIHSESHFLTIGQGCSKHRLTPYYFPHYSIEWLVKQVHGYVEGWKNGCDITLSAA